VNEENLIDWGEETKVNGASKKLKNSRINPKIGYPMYGRGILLGLKLNR